MLARVASPSRRCVSAMYLPSLLIAWQPMQWPLPTLLFTAAGAPWYGGVLFGPPSSVQVTVGAGVPLVKS